MLPLSAWDIGTLDKSRILLLLLPTTYGVPLICVNYYLCRCSILLMMGSHR